MLRFYLVNSSIPSFLAIVELEISETTKNNLIERLKRYFTLSIKSHTMKVIFNVNGYLGKMATPSEVTVDWSLDR